MKAQYLVFTLIALSLTGCVNMGSSQEATSEEKASVYMDMGIRYLEIGELRTAKESLEKALNLDAGNSNIHDAIAVLYEKIQEPENAKTHYQISLKIDPENPQSENNFGRFLCEQGQYEEGLHHLNSAINMPLNNRKWYALTNAGRCLLKQGQKSQAESNFREALQLQSDYPPALLEMLKLTYNEENYLSARAFLQRYQAVSQPNPEFLWYGMQIEYALHHKAIAEEYKAMLLNDFANSEEAKQVKTSISN